MQIIGCLFILFILLFFSRKNESEDKFIDCKDVLVSETIRKVKVERGILSVSNFRVGYSLSSWCPLVYKDTFPSWIEGRYASDFSIKGDKFEPTIMYIEVPYVLYKKANDCYFYLVKNRDTLKFKIVDFD